MIDYTKSAQLKEEGNKLYAQKSYAQAYVKYTCAIGEDANNAVLFANRAACSLAEKKYRLAADDAEKATMLDPGYAKAWARLATAQDVLSGGVKSVHAWQKALDSLPKSGLTPAEQKQKEQYQSGLQSAKESQVIRMTGGNGKAPWDRAEAMRPELMERRYEMVNSSAWVILNAYKEFKDGVSDMMKVKKVQTPQGTALGGKFGALAGITNGIIRDERVFHIESNEWTPKYNDQVCLEAQQSGAWVNVKSEGVIKEAPARLRQQGWDKLRPALSVTVRAWMMRGFMEGGTRGAYSIAVSFFGECLEVLDWGRRVWKDVPVEDKDVIFKDTFIRAVRSLHLSAFMQAHDQDPGPNSKYPLEDLLAEADEILCDVLSHPPPTEGEYDPGFILSFYVYPAGLALSMKGFYHARTAQLALKEHDIDAAKDHYRKAGDFYIDAANKYPEDDEQHAYFLNCGVENFFKCGTPLRTNLALLKRIRLAVPKMRRIWSDSAMSKQGRDEIFDRALENEKMLLDAIQSGQFTLDDKVMPKWE